MSDSTDPRGWLKFCPELSQFTSDPAVAAAMAAGSARKLHAALEKRKKGPRGAFEGRAIDAILAQRRLFLDPVAAAPSLYTMNGIGTMIWGKSDVGSDGTYVGTLFFVLVFLPIWPIAQYLLYSQGNQYQFFGKLPLSRTMRLWRAAVAVALLAGVAGITGAVWRAGKYADVHVVNGLDLPVAVELAGTKLTLPPGVHAMREVEVGKARVRATAPDGRVLEELELAIPRSTDLVVYNPLGAAPLFVESVTYVSSGATPPDRETYTLAAGKPFFARDDVDYLFRDPPKKIETNSSSGKTLRWRAGVLEGGWRMSLAALSFEGRTADAAALVERIVAAEPDAKDAVQTRVALTLLTRGPEAALPLAREAATTSPEDVELQRTFEDLLVVTGRGDEARRIFAERARKEPDSPAAGYLSARVEPNAIALPAFETLARRFPKDTYVRRGLAWAYQSAGRPADAVREWDALAALDPEGGRRLVEYQVTSLAAAGRAADALARVEKAFQEQGGDVDLAILYAEVARLLPKPPKPPRHLLDALLGRKGDEALTADQRTSAKARAAAVLGEPPPSPQEVAAVAVPRLKSEARLLVEVARDPAKAVEIAKTTGAEVIAGLPRGVAGLLAGEAARRGDADLVLLVAGQASQIDAPPAAIAAFVRGEDVTDLEDVPPADRASLLVARARAADAAGRDARPLYAAAAAADPLRGPAAVAMAKWPKPGEGRRAER
jgi:tetratricopeptide (TPR) repeat protein